MKFIKNLSIKNLKRKPVRTAALIMLAAFLSMSVFAGSVTVMSLQNGLGSYRQRLGADIVVVPYEAQTKGSLESILLQGIPGYFYMDSDTLDKVKETEGVETASPQFFLASTSAGCCSAAVQIIGFEPETDFSIQPWIREKYSGAIADGDIVVGNNIAVPENKLLKFYNVECRVAAQLEATGTGLDNAVYTNMSTIKSMIGNADSLGFDYLKGRSADRIISSVMVKVQDGYSIDEVTNTLNIKLRKVKAVQTQSMISSVADGISSVSGFIGVLTVMIWILAIVILIIAFVMIAHERKKEFAILRVIGASQGMLARLMAAEALIVSLAGAVIGVGAASLIVFPFADALRRSLNLPLLPDIRTIIVVILGSVAVSTLAGVLAASLSAGKITHGETGLILRDNA